MEQSAARAGDSYAVTFVPYGYGPGGTGRSLVVRINRSKPVGKQAKAYPLEGRNVVLDMASLRAGQAIAVGGTYSGTITFVRRGNMLVLGLRKVD